MVSENSTIVRNKKIAWQKVDEKYVLVSPRTKKIHVLHGSGGRIWEHIEKPKTTDDLVGLMCDEYDVSEDVVRKDISEYVSKLKEEDIVLTEG